MVLGTWNETAEKKFDSRQNRDKYLSFEIVRLLLLFCAECLF